MLHGSEQVMKHVLVPLVDVFRGFEAEATYVPLLAPAGIHCMILKIANEKIAKKEKRLEPKKRAENEPYRRSR